MSHFNQPARPTRSTIVNLKVSDDEAATIDGLGVLLNLPGGRSGVLREALDTLLAGLPAETRANLDEVVRAARKAAS